MTHLHNNNNNNNSPNSCNKIMWRMAQFSNRASNSDDCETGKHVIVKEGLE